MKRKDILRFLPYEADYKLLEKCRKWDNIALWVIGVLSSITPILKNYTSIFMFNMVLQILEYCNFILIIGYYILDTFTETFLYPATARKRREGFIDNSLGSKYLEKKVEGYYSNDQLSVGPFKMIINCGENCFFTYNIAKSMIPRVIVKNALFFSAFLTVAYFGFKDSLVALPILQILLSSLFLTELVHHMNFIGKLSMLLDRFKEAYSSRSGYEKTLQTAVLLYLDYETTLAYNKAPLSNSVYEKSNEKLTKEWEDIKQRYEIQ